MKCRTQKERRGKEPQNKRREWTSSTGERGGKGAGRAKAKREKGIQRVKKTKRSGDNGFKKSEKAEVDGARSAIKGHLSGGSSYSLGPPSLLPRAPPLFNPSLVLLDPLFKEQLLQRGVAPFCLRREEISNRNRGRT